MIRTMKPLLLASRNLSLFHRCATQLLRTDALPNAFPNAPPSAFFTTSMANQLPMGGRQPRKRGREAKPPSVDKETALKLRDMRQPDSEAVSDSYGKETWDTLLAAKNAPVQEEPAKLDFSEPEFTKPKEVAPVAPLAPWNLKSPHPSGLNRDARRRLRLIERRMEFIRKSLGVPPGSDEKADEIKKQLESWIKHRDEKAEARSRKKEEQRERKMYQRNRKMHAKANKAMLGELGKLKYTDMNEAERGLAMQASREGSPFGAEGPVKPFVRDPNAFYKMRHVPK